MGSMDLQGILLALREGRRDDFAHLAGQLGPEDWDGAAGEAILDECMALPAEALQAALSCSGALDVRQAGRPAGEPLACRAARFGREDLLALLWRRGADMDRKDEWGKSAMHHAAACGRAGCARALLGWGAMPDQRDRDGRTPLALACAAGHVELAGALLSAGADPCSQDDRGNSLYDTASERCRGLLEEPIGRRRSELDKVAVKQALLHGAERPGRRVRRGI